MAKAPGYLNIDMTLLQITTNGSEAVDTTAVADSAAESIRVIDLLLKGGFVMIPLIILLFVAIYVFVERILTVKKASKIPRAVH